MKIFIATDIHGSAYYANKVVEKFKQCNADQLILLGDIYNHGPRNPFPKEYSPMRVADALNSIADKVISVQGNCDSEVDQMISEFPFVPEHILILPNRRVYFTHGHIKNKGNFPLCAKAGDIVFYGHFHVSEASMTNGVMCVIVGSTSLPKDGRNAYCILNDNAITVYDLNTDEIILLRTI